MTTENIGIKTRHANNKISLVVPAYNEENAIIPVIEEYIPYVDEIVIVDDGSTDKTFFLALDYIKNRKDPAKTIKLVRHKRNYGKAVALNTGVRNSSGNIVVFTDADCTYPSYHIPRLIEEIEKGADLVIGSRFLPKPPKNMSFFHKFGNKLLSGIVSYISSTHITDSQSGMRAFRREIFPQIDVKARSLEYEPKATARAAKLGYKIKEIPIHYRKRIGKSKISAFKDPFKIIFSLINIAYTETTLLARAIIVPSLFLLLIGLIAGGVSVRDYLAFGMLKHPYLPLITTLLLLLAAQFFSLGLIIDNITKKLTRIEEKIIKNENSVRS